MHEQCDAAAGRYSKNKCTACEDDQGRPVRKKRPPPRRAAPRRAALHASRGARRRGLGRHPRLGLFLAAGRVSTAPCTTWQGSGVQTGEEDLEVYIEQGIPDGGEIVFEGKGDQGKEEARYSAAFPDAMPPATALVTGISLE